MPPENPASLLLGSPRRLKLSLTWSLQAIDLESFPEPDVLSGGLGHSWILTLPFTYCVISAKSLTPQIWSPHWYKNGDIDVNQSCKIFRENPGM